MSGSLASLVAAGAAYAVEGFHSDLRQAPAAVRRAWGSVFIYVKTDDATHKLTNGTAFLVKQVKSGRLKTVYWLTNAHVVAACPTDGVICPEAYMVEKAEFQKEPDKPLALGEVSGVFKNLIVVRRSVIPDLALVRFDVAADKPMPPALHIAADCGALSFRQNLYTIGYPAVFIRTAPGQQIFDQPTMQIKRWSQGVLTGYRPWPGHPTVTPAILTTVDVLHGNSGGPLLAENGDVVGVVASSAALDTNGNRYDGNEEVGELDWHSKAVNCADLADFIEGRPAQAAAQPVPEKAETRKPIETSKAEPSRAGVAPPKADNTLELDWERMKQRYGVP